MRESLERILGEFKRIEAHVLARVSGNPLSSIGKTFQTVSLIPVSERSLKALMEGCYHASLEPGD